jgi:hypothetical protein
MDNVRDAAMPAELAEPFRKSEFRRMLPPKNFVSPRNRQTEYPQRKGQSPLPHLSRKGHTVNLRELAEAAKKTWPLEDDAVSAFAAACSPERILALLDVAEAAEGTSGHRTASGKTRWWRDDGMAGAALWPTRSSSPPSPSPKKK